MCKVNVIMNCAKVTLNLSKGNVGLQILRLKGGPADTTAERWACRYYG